MQAPAISTVHRSILPLLCCLWSSLAWASFAPQPANADPSQPPSITLSGDHDLIVYEPGKEYSITVTVTDPDAGELLTLALDLSDFPETDYSFSPGLPLSGQAPLVTELRFTPSQPTYGNYESIALAATDAAGNTTQLMWQPHVRYTPRFLIPEDPIVIGIDQPFYFKIPVVDEGENVGLVWNTDAMGFGERNSAEVYLESGSSLPTAEHVGTYQVPVFSYDVFSGITTWDTLTLIVSADCTNQYWYPDLDADGYGSGHYQQLTCSSWPGLVANNEDCNDQNATINPEAAEVSGDGIDNNCNGEVDEGTSCLAREPLKLSASCSDGAGQSRWLVYNPNSCAVAISWWIHKTGQQGSLVAQPGENYFTTQSVSKGGEVAFISWTNTVGETQKKGISARSAKCGKGGSKNARTALAETGADQLLAYPMPFHNSLKLALSSITTNSTFSIRLYAADGRQFDLSNQARVVQEGTLALDLTNAALPAGMYLLRLWVDRAAPVSLKVVKQQE